MHRYNTAIRTARADNEMTHRGIYSCLEQRCRALNLDFDGAREAMVKQYPEYLTALFGLRGKELEAFCKRNPWIGKVPPNEP